MNTKQINAEDDSASLIDDIADNFQALKLPRLADPSLYIGTALPVLQNFLLALREQRSEDDKMRFRNRMRYAGIQKERTADTFKWDDDTYPLAEPGIIESVLSIDFIKHCRSLIVAGPPGTGKTMLVTIIACKAIWAELSVLYKTAHDIATEIKEAKSSNSLSRYIKRLQARDLLVIEDVTFATFDRSTAQAFFSIMDKRYGRKSTIITANGNISEWAAGFPDKPMSSAILGRFYEDALLINMNGAADMRLNKAKSLLGDVDRDNPGRMDELQ